MVGQSDRYNFWNFCVPFGFYQKQKYRPYHDFGPLETKKFTSEKAHANILYLGWTPSRSLWRHWHVTFKQSAHNILGVSKIYLHKKKKKTISHNIGGVPTYWVKNLSLWLNIELYPSCPYHSELLQWQYHHHYHYQLVVLLSSLFLFLL